MVVPPVTLLVPMFVFMVNTGFVNHLQSVIIFYTGLLVPFAIFFMTGFFRTIPQELIEAAASEGAGPFTVFRRIVLPLSGAASFTLIVVQGIWVWNELLNIPYGETSSYGELAARLGQPTASRAVGLANGRNPISIVVPCHRVVGSNGSLTGGLGV